MLFDWGIWVVVVIGVVGFFIAWFISWLSVMPTYEYEYRSMWKGVLILWLIGYALSNGIATLSSLTSKPAEPSPVALTYAAVAESEFGFVAGEPYTLVLGDRLGGSSGETNATTTTRAGLFSARSSTTLTGSTAPASSVSLGYSYEARYYILDIPTANIVFNVSEVKEPSVTIWMTDARDASLAQDFLTPYQGEGCDWRFNNILLMCLWPPYEETGPRTTQMYDEAITNMGFPTILMSGYQRAEITLTQEMYNELLGIIE